MIRSSVVLPQPDGPRKHTSSPGWMTRSIDFSATKSPNALWTDSRRRASLEEFGKEAAMCWMSKDSGQPRAYDGARR